MKLFQNPTSGFRGEKILSISLSPHSAKSLPHGSHVFRLIKISLTIEKGQTRNNLVKLYQILTTSFGEEDFLRISSCPYSAKCFHSPEPCLFTDQTFTNNFFQKGHPRKIPVKLLQNWTSGFREKDF